MAIENPTEIEKRKSLGSFSKYLRQFSSKLITVTSDENKFNHIIQKSFNWKDQLLEKLMQAA